VIKERPQAKQVHIAENLGVQILVERVIILDDDQFPSFAAKQHKVVVGVHDGG
jgi:hypothetical protein